jgi:probable F420-dependent oxidoreductase
MTLRRFRFGLDVGDNFGRDEFVSLVRRADSSGFSTVTGPDHIGSRLAAVLPMLSVAAEVSSRLRISPMVLANDFRHPVVLAKDSATMDILSEGRFELAIGTGWIKPQFDAAGIRYDPPSKRVDRFEEAIVVIKGCWSGQPFSFEGNHYHVTEITCPRPFQRPHPPILIAGGGPRMLKIAGREANIVSLAPVTPGSSAFDNFGRDLTNSGSRVASQIDWIRQGAGPRFDDIELSVFAHHVAVTENAEHEREELGAKTGTTPDEIANSPHMLIGPVSSIVETLLERRERHGISYVVFDSADLDTIEPVIDRLEGQ